MPLDGGNNMDLQENLESIEDQFDDTVNCEPMRCGPRQEDWR